jgi:hypothetical protein
VESKKPAARSASRECMLTLNPFIGVKSSDKVRSTTPKETKLAVRSESRLSRSSLNSAGAFSIVAGRSKLF